MTLPLVRERVRAARVTRPARLGGQNRRVQRTASSALVGALAGLLALLVSNSHAQALPPYAPQGAPLECGQLAQSAWPLTAAGRARLLTTLETRRDACIEHAAFLGLLGALWLEQGEPSQALLWLERSLMLDPTVPATLADHALALAALGEKAAVRELLDRWRFRPDLPQALRARLEAAVRDGSPAASLAARAALPAGGRGLALRRTLSLMRGQESNLDHSPRLTEITLSTPDGPVLLPLAVPLVPREGAAWVGEASLQAQYSADATTLWQFGMLYGGRHSPDEPSTDTHQLQLAASWWKQHTGWRSQVHATVQRVAGPLSEPFDTFLLGVAGEREWNGCWSRLGLDAEQRRQDRSFIVDSFTVALQGGLSCRLHALPGWSAGLATRLAVDRPRVSERPGGTQHQYSVGARAAGPLPGGFRLELAGRYTRLLDREIYSALLSDSRRTQSQQQVSLELSRPLPGLYVSGADLVVQVQQLRQGSNIVLFEQTGRSAFAGIRIDW